jgi:cephalosporin hydroxylase
MTRRRQHTSETLGKIQRWFYCLKFYARGGVRWRGVRCLKNPLDLWQYQHIIHEIRPNLIVELGTFRGGSALFLADVLDLSGNGIVVSVDVRRRRFPKHPRIRYITGSSIDPSTVSAVQELAQGLQTVMVIADSNHNQTHVARELECYCDLVTPGSYYIVEDTNFGVYLGWKNTAHDAVQEFLTQHTEYARDTSRESFVLTFNPGGYLRKSCSENSPQAASCKV